MRGRKFIWMLVILGVVFVSCLYNVTALEIVKDSEVDEDSKPNIQITGVRYLDGTETEGHVEDGTFIPDSQDSNSKTILFIVGIAVVVLIILVILYFLIRKFKNRRENEKTTTIYP